MFQLWPLAMPINTHRSIMFNKESKDFGQVQTGWRPKSYMFFESMYTHIDMD